LIERTRLLNVNAPFNEQADEQTQKYNLKGKLDLEARSKYIKKGLNRSQLMKKSKYNYTSQKNVT